VSGQGLFDFVDLPEWEQAAADDVQVAEVVFNLPLQQPWSYLIPDEFRPLLLPGMRVRVPLGRGNRNVAGYCVRVHRSESPVRRLKSILEVLDSTPLLDSRMLELTEWLATRYLCSWGQVLESVIPAGVKRKAGTRLVQGFLLAPTAEERLRELRLPPGQQAVVDVLRKASFAIPAAEICLQADCGPGPIRGLRKKNLL